MKFISILSLFLSAAVTVDAVGRLRGVEPLTGTSTSNFEAISGNQNSATYSRTVIVSGSINANDLCFDTNRFCFPGGSDRSVAQLYTCLALQNARSQIRAGWALGGTLSVNIDDQANVDAILLSTKSSVGTLAMAFSQSTNEIGLRATVDTTATDLSQVGPAAVRAVGVGRGTAVSQADASSTASSAFSGGSSSSTLIEIAGRQLQQFKGAVIMTATSFANLRSESNTGAIALAAARGFARSVTSVCARFNGGRACKTDNDEDFDNALLRADEFGRAFAAAISQVVVSVALQVSVLDGGNSLRLSVDTTNEKIQATAFFGCERTK